MNFLLILLGKIIVFLSSFLNLGSGSTWPGHIALKVNNNFLKDILTKRKFQIILVAGTNGKTTTGKLIQTILEKNGKRVFQNDSGANLINGIASSIIKNSSIFGKLNYDFAIFEIDENTLPIILEDITADFIICLNLFRDQLDRYGEVNTISEKWKKAFLRLSKKTKLILNADDPQIAYLGGGTRNKTLYFGVKTAGQTIAEHASDSTYCPKCAEKLHYKNIAFSHLGDWLCRKCNLKKPKPDLENFEMYPLPGLYNKYNIHAAILTTRVLGISDDKISIALKSFKPAFGRQEITKYKNKKMQIFLSKNPASFNQSLSVINELKAKHLLLVLNDRIPDGRDVSWIWDVDFERYLNNFVSISVSGDRVYDMALRLEYADNSTVKIYENLEESVEKSIKNLNPDEILYILPTYSAMLDLRKILTGKAIL